MRGKEKGMLSKKIFEKYFYDNYQSRVVLANPRSILNNKYAKKDVKKQVIKADQLIHYIQETTKNNDNVYTEQDLIEDVYKRQVLMFQDYLAKKQMIKLLMC